MSGRGSEKNLTKSDINRLTAIKKISIVEGNMKENILYNQKFLATAVLVTPLIPVIAYATYRLALEVWCIAYGLIY
jgi:hypothetical protein